jgi:hypothetical protein
MITHFLMVPMYRIATRTRLRFRAARLLSAAAACALAIVPSVVRAQTSTPAMSATLTRLASQLDGDAGSAGDAAKVRTLAGAVRDLASATR